MWDYIKIVLPGRDISHELLRKARVSLINQWSLYLPRETQR